MPGKKTSAWRSWLLGLITTVLLYLSGTLVTALLVVQGTVGEERIFLMVAVFALLSSFIGGLTAGRGKAGSRGSLLCVLFFCLFLLLVCLGLWEGITRRGLILLVPALSGGVAAALVCRKVGKRPGRQLVKFHKNLHSI